MLAQRFTEVGKGGKTTSKLHPIAYTSKGTSQSEMKYKLFLLEFTALKFTIDKFDDIIWGSPVELEMDCQALQDILLSNELNTTHAHWRDGILAHQIMGIHHIPGQINIVGDGLSRKDKELPHRTNDGSAWSITPGLEEAQGLHYDLFVVEAQPETLHSRLCDHFKDE